MRLLEPVSEMGERRAQIMRDIVRNLAQAFHEPADPVEHIVDGGGETIEFVARTVHRYAIAEPSRHDAAAGVRDRIDTPQETLAEQQATGESGKKAREQHPAE